MKIEIVSCAPIPKRSALDGAVRSPIDFVWGSYKGVSKVIYRYASKARARGTYLPSFSQDTALENGIQRLVAAFAETQP